MEIHQVIADAVPNDAITGAALEYRKVLRGAAPSEIFAVRRHPQFVNDVRLLADYAESPSARDGHNLLVVHLSIGSNQLFGFLAERPERAVGVYHNMTPARYIAPHETELADLLNLGRAQLAQLAQRFALTMADSAFNAADLHRLGYDNVRVVPVVGDLQRLRGVDPDPDVAARLAALPGPLILFVGQLLPHKRPDLLIEAHAVLTTWLVPEASLAIVGAPRIPGYARTLRSIVSDLNLLRVFMPGSIPTAALVAHYRSAALLATASEHEGFCLPVTEAMSLGVPVIARDRTALPETIGDAGIVLPADADPLLMAEAMAAVIESGPLRADLVERGTARMATTFDNEVVRADFLAALLEVA